MPSCQQPKWYGVLALLILPSVSVFILNALQPTLQGQPTRSPGIQDGRFWKTKEIPDEIIPTWLLFLLSLGLPLFLLALGVFGAMKRDRKLSDAANTASLPFRGWIIGLFNAVYWVSLTMTLILKYYAHQMRPKSIAMCHSILEKHSYNVSNYVASLEQLKACCSYDPDLFQGYPSGHSSMSFCGIFGCGLLLTKVPWLLEGIAASCGGGNSQRSCAGRLGVVWSGVLKGAILFVTGVSAAMIAMTRVLDGSHFPYQVNAGCILGLLSCGCMAQCSLLWVDVPLGGREYGERKKKEVKELSLGEA